MKFTSLILSFLCLTAQGALAQDKYDRFLSQYAASAEIAIACPGLWMMDQQTAATLAKQKHGLRRQKVLRIVYYGNQDSLVKMGRAELRARGVDRNDTKQLCQFGRAIAGKDDTIGRFLIKK